MMFIQYLTGLYFFFAIVSGAPLHGKHKTKDSDKTGSRQKIDLSVLQNATNYETRGGDFEGDMVFPDGFKPSNKLLAKGVAMSGPRRWPNNIIPYDISAITSKSHREIIKSAIRTLMHAVGTPILGTKWRKSCIHFRRKTSKDKDYLKFVYGVGCSSTVGYWSNYPNTLTLHPNCFSSGIIQHELIHALGFYHEQSRPDRDSYITINYANIYPGLEFNFEKYAWGRSVVNQRTPYDYESLMHYGAYDFSRDQLEPTITPLRYGVKIGQREKLSATDITEIRDYYSC